LKKVGKKEERSKDSFEIIPVKDVSKMTIEEAIDRGLLPTPIELARTPDEIMEYGRQAGALYGGAMASIYSALRRRDLPFNVRLAKGIRGATFLLGMLISAMDSFERVRELEDAVLVKKGKIAKEEDLIDELLEELEKLRKENEELKKKVEGVSEK